MEKIIKTERVKMVWGKKQNSFKGNGFIFIYDSSKIYFENTDFCLRFSKQNHKK